MGWIKDPSRALKNKIYHKTTISARTAVKRTSSFFGAIIYLIGLFYYYILVIPIKWILIASWMLLKYTCLGIAWLFVTAFNGIVSLVEWIINLSRKDAPVVEEENIENSDFEQK